MVALAACSCVVSVYINSFCCVPSPRFLVPPSFPFILSLLFPPPSSPFPFLIFPCPFRSLSFPFPLSFPLLFLSLSFPSPFLFPFLSLILPFVSLSVRLLSRPFPFSLSSPFPCPVPSLFPFLLLFSSCSPPFLLLWPYVSSFSRPVSLPFASLSPPFPLPFPSLSAPFPLPFPSLSCQACLSSPFSVTFFHCFCHICSLSFHCCFTCFPLLFHVFHLFFVFPKIGKNKKHMEKKVKKWGKKWETKVKTKWKKVKKK